MSNINYSVDASIDSSVNDIFQKAKSLEGQDMELEEISSDTSSGYLTSIPNKLFSLIGDDTRRVAISYYRLWMLYVISWLGNVFLYVQLAEIISKKDSKTVSLSAYAVLLVSAISWFIYGYLLRDIPLLISGALQIIGVLLLLVFIAKYKGGVTQQRVKYSQPKYDDETSDDED